MKLESGTTDYRLIDRSVAEVFKQFDEKKEALSWNHRYDWI